MRQMSNGDSAFNVNLADDEMGDEKADLKGRNEVDTEFDGWEFVVRDEINFLSFISSSTQWIRSNSVNHSIRDKVNMVTINNRVNCFAVLKTRGLAAIGEQLELLGVEWTMIETIELNMKINRRQNINQVVGQIDQVPNSRVGTVNSSSKLIFNNSL